MADNRNIDPKILNKTHRHVITKLEIPTADPRVQLDVVSSAVFDIHQTSLELEYAMDNNKWHTTDEIYDTAKGTYQSIIEPFTELPKVYKLESTRDKLYAYRLENLNGNMRKMPLRSGASSRYLERMNKNKAVEYLEDQEDEEKNRKQKSIAIEKLTPEEREEYELETIINPFDPPKPWIRKTRLDGEVVYVNEETKQVKTSAPGQVWAEKYKNLEKLVPREDYSGWEYNEDDSEKRKRFRILAEFQKRVASEIQRRNERPNDLEQVEDVLFYVVDTICRREAKKEWQQQQIIKRQKRSTWHPSTIDFRLDPLEPIKNAAADDDEEGIPVITDMEFNDNCIVSICGYVLPKFRPWNLFIKHEHERMKQRLEDEAREAERQLIRNQPLKEKWFTLLQLAKENPNQAVVYLVEGLKNRALEIPVKLRATDKKLLLDLLKAKTVQGARDIVKVLRNPSELIQIPRHIVKALYLKLFPPSQDELALENMIKEMTEKERKEEEESVVNSIQQGRRKGIGKVVLEDMTPIPVTHPDAVLMKILLLQDPPPVFEKIAPPKWYDPAVNIQKDIFDFLAEVSGKKKMVNKKRNPKYRDARMRLPLYAQQYNKSQCNFADLKRDTPQSGSISRISESDLEPEVTTVQEALQMTHFIQAASNPAHLPLNQVVEEEGEEEEHDVQDNHPEAQSEAEKNPNNLPSQNSPNISEHEAQSEREHRSTASGVRSKPSSQPPNLEDVDPDHRDQVVDLESEERSHFSGSTLTTKAPAEQHEPTPQISVRAKRQSIQSIPPNSNALSGYQLGSLTKRLYDNYKDATVGAAPTLVEKDVFDNTKRKLFEDKLIRELSSAACVPPRYFRIEEIRRLPENDHRLHECRKKKEDYFIELEREIQEQKRKEAEQYQLTMELIKRSQLLSRQRQQEKNNINSDENVTNVNEENVPLEQFHTHVEPQESKGEEDADDNFEEDLDKLIGETEEERKARLKASARKKSVWTDNQSQSSPQPNPTQNSASNSPSKPRDPSPTRDILGNEVEHDLAPNSPTKRQEVVLHGHVVNLGPSELAPVNNNKLGLANPEDVLKDPKCWLANELRELTEEERQVKRFKYLQMQYEERPRTKLELLQEELVKIKRKQNELLEVCREFVGPKYEELYRQVNPLKDELSKKLGLYVKNIGKKSSVKYDIAESTDNDGYNREVKVGLQEEIELSQHPDADRNEQMALDVHQKLQDQERSVLADLAQAKSELMDDDAIGNIDRSHEKEGHTHTVEIPLSTDGCDLDDPLVREVKTTLRNMCLAVEYHHHLYLESKSPVSPTSPSHVLSPVMTDIYDDYLEISDEERSVSKEILKGCEISIIVHIDESLKQHIYLRDLRSDDISCFLQHQMKNKRSKLLSGHLTSQIVDIQHKLLLHKRVNFAQWEDLWVHFISPVYYRYTIKPAKREKFNDGQAQGRLPNGLIVYNPLDNFTAAQKVTYNRLPQPAPEKSDDGGVLDYNCDDIGKELSSNLVVYRPNMSALTDYDVMKCKRIMNLFHEKYLHEMKYGLADGTRLRYGQYLALKNYKTSQRIYELAKQKKARDDRAENGDEQLFKPVITKISTETFNTWMKEAKDEEEKELKEARKQAIKLKELRRQEADMRRKYDSQKTWFYGKIFQLNAPIAAELASNVKDIIEQTEEMIVRGGSVTATAQERKEADDYRKEIKIKLIHEEKETRRVWEIICHQYLEEHPGDDQSQSLRGDVEDGLTNPTGVGTRPQTPGDQSQASNHLPTSLPLYAVLHCLDLVKNRKLMDEKHKKYLAKKELKERERLKKEKRREQQERALKLRQQHEMHISVPADHELDVKSNGPNADDHSRLDDQFSNSDVVSLDKDSGSLSALEQPQPADEYDGYSSMSEPLKKFTEEEMRIFSHVHWTQNIWNHDDIYECLHKFPTTVPNTISRDELVQFAKLNIEVCPIIFRAKEEVRKQGEEKQEAKSAHQKRSRSREKKRREDEEKTKSSQDEKLSEEMIYQKMMEEGLAEEAARRKKQFKKAEKRRLKREKAWLYAHQHMYVKIKGLIPYCAVCREKHDQNWLDNYLQSEKVFQDNFEENLTKFKELKEADIRETLETEHIAKIEKERKERMKLIRGTALESDEESGFQRKGSSLIVNYQNETSVKSSVTLPSPSTSSEPSAQQPSLQGDATHSSISNELPPGVVLDSEEKKCVYEVLTSLIQKIEGCFQTTDESSHKTLKSNRSRQTGKSTYSGPIPQYIIESGLAYCDPNGKNIIPMPVNLTEKPPQVDQSDSQTLDDDKSFLSANSSKKSGTIKKKVSKLQDDESEETKKQRIENNPNATIYDLHKHEILLKFWNIEYGEKADFLGYALIPMDVMLHPPKGARSFPLESDPQFVKPGKEKVFLHGSVFVKITPIKLADMRINIPENAPDPHQLLMEKRAQMRSNRRAQPIDQSAGQSISGQSHETKPSIDDDVENYYLPYLWRLEIYRATKMTAMHPIEKNSAICEVCWKGSGKKNNERVYSDGFLTIGETSLRTNTVDPDWRNDPSAVYELPPVWTDRSITNRYEPFPNGGWIAKNHLDEIEKLDGNAQEKTPSGPLKESDKIAQILSNKAEEVHEEVVQAGNNEAGQKMAGKLRFKLAANKVITATKLAQHTIVDLEKKIADQMEIAVFLYKAEELERQCMAREEKIVRASIRESFQKLEKPFLEEQRFYEREFSNLIQKIREPPPYLARARFLMGSPMLGGGGVTMCEDPATQNKIDVISIPILYEEDEEELARNINYLLGNPHENLIKVIEFSVHQVLGFAYTGAATTNQRIAMIICEKIPAISMMEHIDKNWSSFTDEDFKVALIQIVGALVALHRSGIIHRNLHPDAVMIQTKSNLTDENSDDEEDDQNEQTTAATSASYSRRSTFLSSKSSYISEQSSVHDNASVSDNASGILSHQSSTVASKSTKAKVKPLYQLTDFWFFHNPRKVGCSYSEGRADWGNRRTVPPEGEGGYKITEKSDIWALGVCIYTWCTRGLHLPITDGQHFDFQIVMQMIPLKWGQWVNSLIKMCLQRNPKFRASASDIYQFLVLTKTKG